MSIAARLRQLLGVAAVADTDRCTADWRRPNGYWRCTRPFGHGGRHRMRAAERGVFATPLRAVADGDERDGGVAAG